MANRLTAKQRRENAERRERGEKVVGCYCMNPTTDPDSALVDMLADLMHYEGHGKSIQSANIYFFQSLRRAQAHFEAERRGEE